jgi:hypothetical protein
MEEDQEHIWMDDEMNYEADMQYLIENGLDGYNLKDRCVILRQWIIDKYELSPVDFLGCEMFLNYLEYILLNSIDTYIGNTKPFIPTQIYALESIRIFKLDLTTHDLCKSCSETGTQDLNVKSFYELQLDICFEENKFYDHTRYYSNEYKREFRNRNNHCFSESYIKTLMDPKTYDNFLIYRLLYLKDERIGNYAPFRPNQDYHQEYVRELKLESIKEGLKKDEIFTELWYMIYCNIRATISYGQFNDPMSIDKALQRNLEFNANQRKQE